MAVFSKSYCLHDCIVYFFLLLFQPDLLSYQDPWSVDCYPQADPSYLLENRPGVWLDVTDELAPALRQGGAGTSVTLAER